MASRNILPVLDNAAGLWEVICGLYYKHIMIVNYDSSIVNKFRASFTDDAWIVINDCHMFTVHATGNQFVSTALGHRLFENPGKLAAVI